MRFLARIARATCLVGVALAAAEAAAGPDAKILEPQTSGSTAELRGLAARDARTAWASGAGGTVLRTRDGKTWEKLSVRGGEGLDFRDLEWLGGETVVLLAAGPGDKSRIFRSADGGRTWEGVHVNPDPGGFYDAIAFWDDRNGVLLGDPVGGRFRIRLTSDGGKTWTDPPSGGMSEALPGEGAFAASGTCLFALKGSRNAWFVTGGARVSRVFRTFDRGVSWSASVSPVPAGNASTGLFSVAFLDGKRGFAVGGDYRQPEFSGLNGARVDDGGRKWTAAPVAPTGFFSAVAPIPASPGAFLATGLAGTAVTGDGGRTWRLLDPSPYNAAAFAPDGAGWAVGPKGKIAKLTVADPGATNRSTSSRR